MGMPDSTGTIDALGHLYGTENVLIDMLEESEQVKHAIDIVNRGWISTNEMFYQISRELNGRRGLMVDAPSGAGQADPYAVRHVGDVFGRYVWRNLRWMSWKQQMEWLEYPVIIILTASSRKSIWCISWR